MRCKDCKDRQEVCSCIYAKQYLKPGGRTIIAEMDKAAREKAVRILMEKTAEHYGVKPFDLKDSTRKKRVVMARSVAMYIARRGFGLTLENIGREFNRRHCTVRYAVLKVEGDRDLIRSARYINQLM